MAYKKSTIPDISRRLRKLERAASEVLTGFVPEYAGRVASEFRKRVREQAFRAFDEVPLAPSTVERKDRKGLDPRTMVATGHYVSSIRVFKLRDMAGGGHRFFIGHGAQDVALDEDGNRTDTSLRLVARVQEYGSSRVPSRPHWTPHLRRLQRELPGVARAVRRAILRSAAGRGGASPLPPPEA
jgi:hypothetical protein